MLLDGKVILLFEDEPLIALDLLVKLNAAGASVTDAITAEEALSALRAGRYHAAILDYRPDEMRCTAVAELCQATRVPFIVFSDYPRNAAMPGAAAWIRKPSSTPRLVLRLADLLDPYSL